MMRDILHEAMERMTANGAEFCDARFQQLSMLSVKVVDGGVRSIKNDSMSGVCFRSRIGGSWGYSSTVSLDKESLLEACLEAPRNAGMGTAPGDPLPEYKFDTGTVKAKVRNYPADIALEEKLADLMELDKAQRIEARIVNTNSEYDEGLKRNILVNSMGADLEWEEIRTRVIAMTVASDGDRTEFYWDMYDGAKGYELVNELDLNDIGDKCAKEAIAMLSALKPPSGLMTCISDPGITGTLAHEVIGHAAEADEVVKKRSFLTGLVGERVASDLITMVDDGTVPGARGTIPYDDEGIRGSRTVLIEDGIYKGYMHSLETAAMMNEAPTGNGRAEDYSRRVWVRMTNTYFEPGDWTLEEMVEDIDFGVITDKTISGMEDPVGGGFEAQTLRGYLVEKGKISGLVRSFALTGNALEILKTTDAVGKELKLDGGTCGKGIEDWAPVSTGGAYCRSKIMVGGG
jgi:TldD protein